MQAASSDRKKEFYSLLQEYPEYLEFTQTARRINVTLRSYACFVLDYAGTEVNAGEATTAFGFIYTLANNPQQREVARLLIESETDWTSAASQIYTLAQQAPDSLSSIKSAFSTADTSIIPLKPVISTGTTQTKPLTSPSKSRGYGIDEIASMDGINQELVRDTDEYLQILEIEGVWQDVDVSKPERVHRIARYILAEIDADSPHIKRILKDHRLRKDYFSLFNGKPETLDKIMEGLNPNDVLYNNLARQRLTTNIRS